MPVSQVDLTNLTPAQQAVVDRVIDEWLRRQTETNALDQIREAVIPLWRRMGYTPPEVVLVPSPAACLEYACDLMSKRNDMPDVIPSYQSVWWRGWAGWYEAVKELGIKFPEAEYHEFRNWCLRCPFVCPYDELVIVSQNPIKVSWNEDRTELSCEDGPCILYEDGFDIWIIDGVRVDEQIVMRPETQTIAQIHEQQSEEVRRIRVERFGLRRYVKEANVTVVDTRRNPIENTFEMLIAPEHFGQQLMTHCPSTGREYMLAIPDEPVRTCEQAQARLWGDRPNFNIIGRT